MTELTDAQQAILDRALARMNQVPTQRTRAAAQGLTFGTADEIEARARALATGRPYAEVLEEIRGGLEAYREDRPIESIGYELGGAFIPALFSGGSAAAPTLGRMALTGAAQGAAYGFGTGEGGFGERLSRVPGGAAGGAAGGLVGGAAARGVAGLTNVATDVLRRGAGQRGSSVVENEIQRLVEQTGRTPDQISQRVAGGRILAEDPNISMAVRTLRAQGGVPSQMLQQTLERRPALTREQAMQQLRQYLSGGETGALRAQRYSEDVARAAERQAYSQFENVPAPDDVVESLGEALQRVPAASREVEEALRASTGQAPFYQITEEGVVEFARRPTVAEAERVRRAIDNRASALYREGMGGAGEAVSGVGQALRNVLDLSVEDLATVRGQAAAMRANRDAFEQGRRALSGDVNERLLEFEALTDPEAIQAYRAGFMSALERGATSNRRQSLIRNLADPQEEAAENIMLRAVMPEESLDSVLNAIQTAAESQTAASRIMGGSPTQDVALEARRQGMNISAADMFDVLGGSPVAAARVAFNLVRPMTGNLSDAERTRIAQVLISEDPELVRRAAVDESALAALQQRVAQIMMAGTRGATGAGATAGAMPAAEISGRAIGGLLGGPQ